MKHGTLITTLLLAGQTLLPAQQNFDDVEIKTTHVAGSVYLLEGAGGNIGVSVGDDGIIMIDDQFAPLADKIETAVRKLNDGRIRFLVNTHWHGDHTGGNPHFGAMTDIIAHREVLTRLADKAGTPKDALPVITFNDGLSLHLNGDTIHVYHFGPGHTDGDSIVAFMNANVVHLGDMFFNGCFPFIDQGSGGSVEGYVQVAGDILKKLPDDVKIIPGHGPLGTKADYTAFHQMLVAVTGDVKKSIAAGKTLDEVKTAGVREEYKSWSWGFINESRFLEICYNGLKSN